MKRASSAARRIATSQTRSVNSGKFLEDPHGENGRHDQSRDAKSRHPSVDRARQGGVKEDDPSYSVPHHEHDTLAVARRPGASEDPGRKDAREDEALRMGDRALDDPVQPPERRRPAV